MKRKAYKDLHAAARPLTNQELEHIKERSAEEWAGLSRLERYEYTMLSFGIPEPPTQNRAAAQKPWQPLWGARVGAEASKEFAIPPSVLVQVGFSDTKLAPNDMVYDSEQLKVPAGIGQRVGDGRALASWGACFAC